MSTLFDIVYAETAADDVRALRAFDQRKIMEGIEEHLAHQPQRTSRSRIKAMTQPFWSQYRLRVDDFRVYYDVDEDKRIVNVLRVLEKRTEPTPQEKPDDEDSNVER